MDIHALLGLDVTLDSDQYGQDELDGIVNTNLTIRKFVKFSGGSSVTLKKKESLLESNALQTHHIFLSP